MIENDDPGIRPRLAFPFALDGSSRPNAVAVKHRPREIDPAHGEIADRGAERRVGHGHSDHECKGEQAIDQRFAIFRLRRLVKVDV